MLALIAGTGDLPRAVLAALPDRPLICALEGFEPSVTPDITFRLERLGSFLRALETRGVTRICMVGSVRRPALQVWAFDLATLRLVPTILRSIRKGDDGALRGFIAVLEARGFAVVAAQDVAPDLLPPAGVLTRAHPAPYHVHDASVGQGQVALMGEADLGQACVVRDGRIIATEDEGGTDAMLIGARDIAVGAVLFKAPKPRQDRRADLPVIGVRTAMDAAAAGLAGIVIEAGGVMVLDLAGVIDVLDDQGMFLWVRPKEAA
ncbi:LpxI family protein [Loktanella sp. DJP18]|uniref:LpxI family protein n=1 Tax=Loktanella sp. DJP18 TaxID=3409788 RepID=UPI003BB729CD